MLDDVAQDAALAVLELAARTRREGVAPPDRPGGPWLGRTVRNVAREHVRRAVRSAATARRAAGRAPRSPSLRERLHAVDPAGSSLSATERDVVMSVVGGASEIAVASRIGTSRSRVRRIAERVLASMHGAGGPRRAAEICSSAWAQAVLDRHADALGPDDLRALRLRAARATRAAVAAELGCTDGALHQRFRRIRARFTGVPRGQLRGEQAVIGYGL